MKALIIFSFFTLSVVSVSKTYGQTYEAGTTRLMLESIGGSFPSDAAVIRYGQMITRAAAEEKAKAERASRNNKIEPDKSVAASGGGGGGGSGCPLGVTCASAQYLVDTNPGETYLAELIAQRGYDFPLCRCTTYESLIGTRRQVCRKQPNGSPCCFEGVFTEGGVIQPPDTCRKSTDR